MALLLSFVILGIYFFTIFKFSVEIRSAVFNVKTKLFYAPYGAALLLPGLLLFFLLKDEKFIYFWDYSGYWHRAISFTNEFFESPFKALKGVYQSVRHEEYNSLPNVLLAPANRLLGLNFNNYVFSIYLIYLVPFALVLSSLIIKMHPEISNRLKLALPFFILCFAPCLLPIRYGFLDAVGLVFIALVLSTLIRSNYLRERKIKQSVFIGLMLLLLIFNRRWYAFWFVAFYVSVFAVNVIAAVKYKDRKIVINSIINLGVAGVVPMVIMLTLFYPYFKMTVLKDYTDIYSAYRSAGFLHQANNFNLFFGMFIILTALAGLVLSFKKEKSLLGFFCISSVIVVVLFMRVNDFGGLQHYYLLVPFFLIFFLQAVIYASRKKYIAPALFVVLLINSFFVFALNPYDGNAYVFSTIEGKAFSRPDYDQIERIADKVIELHNKGNYVYCLASAGALNEDIIKNIKLPDLSNPVFKLQRTQHLDKRDRFPNELFLADYVITTLPAELHLGAESQKVIAYFNNAIMEGDLKQHYEKVEEYTLQNNVTAYLMKKTSSLNNAEIQTIHDYFRTAYPEYEQMFAINRTILKTSGITVGNGYGAVSFENENTLNLCPGATRPSEISFMFDENDTNLSFTATFNNKETIASECNSAKDGEVNLIIKENGAVIKTLYLTHKKEKNINLDVSGKKQITIIVNKGKNEDYCDWFKLTNIIIK
ncbi:hypothetical protein AMR72_07965 [Flavobacterium psychrophilum]|nr:hypothetical protein AMR72_07965 [Flavobacterium psychrophilum]AOE52446.1 hypothetical protein ALW18_07955 [Flavobacterium psychrophilum]